MAAFCLEVAVCSSLGNRSNGAALPGVISSPLNLLLMTQPGQTVARFRLRQLTSAVSQTPASTNDGSGPMLLSRGRYRSLRLAQDVASRTCPHTGCPMPKGHSMYPVIALIALTLFTWFVAIWASCDDAGEEPHDVEKPETSSDAHDHRNAA